MHAHQTMMHMHKFLVCDAFGVYASFLNLNLTRDCLKNKKKLINMKKPSHRPSSSSLDIFFTQTDSCYSPAAARPSLTLASVVATHRLCFEPLTNRHCRRSPLIFGCLCCHHTSHVVIAFHYSIVHPSLGAYFHHSPLVIVASASSLG